MQSDPIGLAGGFNTYGYVGGRPTISVDIYGLCDCQVILENVEKLNNDKKYSYNSEYGFGKDTNKCNLFVFDVLEPTGVAPKRWLGLGGPISAGKWADPDAEIPNFPIVKYPMPGDIVAIKHEYADASGHVAIVLIPGISTIGAGGSGSHITGWPWDKKLSPQGIPVYRRCSCEK